MVADLLSALTETHTVQTVCADCVLLDYKWFCTRKMSLVHSNGVELLLLCIFDLFFAPDDITSFIDFQVRSCTTVQTTSSTGFIFQMFSPNQMLYLNIVLLNSRWWMRTEALVSP